MTRFQDLPYDIQLKIWEPIRLRYQPVSYYDACAWILSRLFSCRGLLSVGRQFLYQDIHISSIKELLSLSRAFSTNVSLADLCVKLALRLPKHCLAAANEELQEGVLAASVLTDLLASAERIQHLTISDQKWESMEDGLRTAAFSESLHFLSLISITLASSDLPLKSLSHANRFPKLEELRFSEERTVESLLGNTAPDDNLTLTTSTLSLADPWSNVWLDMQSLTIMRLDWSLEQARLDLPSLGGHLQKLSLTIPADVICAMPQNFASMLPHLERFDLELSDIESTTDYSWVQSLCTTLQAAASLEAFSLTAVYIPAIICEYLPDSLCDITLKSCHMEQEQAYREDSLFIQNSTHCVDAGMMDRLSRLTYEPTTTLIAFMSPWHWDREGAEEPLALGEEYIGLFGELQRTCVERRIALKSNTFKEMKEAFRQLESSLQYLSDHD